MPKLKGSNMDMAPVGPIPGRTPINVPIKTPAKQKSRFMGCSVVWKPDIRPENRSILSPFKNSHRKSQS
jgi:hypothetical protein